MRRHLSKITNGGVRFLSIQSSKKLKEVGGNSIFGRQGGNTRSSSSRSLLHKSSCSKIMRALIQHSNRIHLIHRILNFWFPGNRSKTSLWHKRYPAGRNVAHGERVAHENYETRAFRAFAMGITACAGENPCAPPCASMLSSSFFAASLPALQRSAANHRSIVSSFLLWHLMSA